MATTIVERLHNEFKDLLEVLDKAGEISFRSTADDSFRKSLLLAAASNFERKLTDDVLNFFSNASNANSLVTNFVKNKAISRQYHTWFNWDGKNANQFFSLFGKDFTSYMKKLIEHDTELDQAIRAFLELGRDRNRLVHQDFGSFSLEKTSEEIFQLYSEAKRFIEAIPTSLHNYSEILEGHTSSPSE